MMKMVDLKHVLVVSENRAFFDSIKIILPPDEFDLSLAESGNEARRFIVTRHFDILVINLPLPDEHGLSFAQDYVDSSMGILMICPAASYDSLAAEAEENGIVVLSNANPPAFIYVAVKMIASMVKRLERLEKKNRTLQDKMGDIRVINKAKWLLIENKKMTEADAHKYIEKRAMNDRISSRQVAEEILEELE